MDRAAARSRPRDFDRVGLARRRDIEVSALEIVSHSHDLLAFYRLRTGFRERRQRAERGREQPVHLREADERCELRSARRRLQPLALQQPGGFVAREALVEGCAALDVGGAVELHDFDAERALGDRALRAFARREAQIEGELSFRGVDEAGDVDRLRGFGGFLGDGDDLLRALRFDSVARGAAAAGESGCSSYRGGECYLQLASVHGKRS